VSDTASPDVRVPRKMLRSSHELQVVDDLTMI
jgi:hypothetical protein